MFIGGIDPGKRGAMCVMNKDGLIVAIEPITSVGNEINLSSIVNFIKQYKDISMFYVERPHAVRIWGVSGSFKFGLYCGMIEGVLSAFAARYQLVKPKAWQKIMHQGTSPDIKPKERSLQVSERLFRGNAFLETPRCKKPHDGMIDAALIAEYGRRQNFNV